MTSLVLLPGTLCTEALFAPQVEALTDVADIQVLPLTTGATIAACAAATLQRAPKRFALTGFSQGGVVALEMMRQAPQRVAKLCLISTNPRGSTPQNLETWARWQGEVCSGSFADIVCFHTEQVGTEQVGDVPEKAAVRRSVKEMAFTVGSETFLRQLEMLSSRTDSRSSLGEIFCPTLLIGGDQDRVTPPEFHEEMCALIPHATFVPLACGHYAPLEQPEAVSALLREWFMKASIDA